jgi:hypothetical protein
MHRRRSKFILWHTRAQRRLSLDGLPLEHFRARSLEAAVEAWAQRAKAWALVAPTLQVLERAASRAQRRTPLRRWARRGPLAWAETQRWRAAVALRCPLPVCVWRDAATRRAAALAWLERGCASLGMAAVRSSFAWWRAVRTHAASQALRQQLRPCGLGGLRLSLCAAKIARRAYLRGLRNACREDAARTWARSELELIGKAAAPCLAASRALVAWRAGTAYARKRAISRDETRRLVRAHLRSLWNTRAAREALMGAPELLGCVPSPSSRRWHQQRRMQHQQPPIGTFQPPLGAPAAATLWVS